MNPEESNKQGADPQEMYKDPGLQETRASGEEIVSGARQEDQLDKFKKDVPEGGRDSYPNLQSGVQPNAYKTPKEQDNNNE